MIGHDDMIDHRDMFKMGQYIFDRRLAYMTEGCEHYLIPILALLRRAAHFSQGLVLFSRTERNEIYSVVGIIPAFRSLGFSLGKRHSPSLLLL